MRTTLFSVAAMAVAAFATPQGIISQIGDGQIQAPTGSAPAPPMPNYTTVPAAPAPPAPAATTAAAVSNIPAAAPVPAPAPSYPPQNMSSPVAPVNTSPPPSYPVPGNTTAAWGSTAAPPIKPTFTHAVAPTRVTSSVFVNPTPNPVPTQSAAAVSPVNVADAVAAKMGLTGAVVAGLVALLA